MKNLKKFSALLLALVMMLSLSVTAFAANTANTGTIEQITSEGTVSGNDITVKNCTINFSPSDTSIGRYTDGWWVGAKIIAPASVNEMNVANVMYSNDGTDNLAKSFGQNNDGKTAEGNYYMGCWVPVYQANLEGALAANTTLSRTYKFDWDGDGAVDQTFKIIIDPKDITLNKDGETVFQSVNGVVKVSGGAGTSSIVIDNAVKGETYTLYKIFDLTYVEPAEGQEVSAVSYTYTKTSETDALYGALAGTGSPFTLNASTVPNVYVVELKKDKTAAEIVTFLKGLVTDNTLTTTIAAQTAVGTTVTFASLNQGYYFMDTTLGALCTLDSTMPSVTIKEKNSVPSITKDVQNDASDDGTAEAAYGESAVLDVIDTVNYKLTVKTGTNENSTGTGVDADYVIVDTLPTGFTYNNSIEIKGDNGTAWTKDTDYTVDYTGQNLTITLLSTGTLSTLAQDTAITITYTAKMNSTVDYTADGNTNNVVLTYKAQESKDSAIVKTYQIGGTTAENKPIIQKVDATNPEKVTALPGVKFLLSKTVKENNANVVKYATVVDGVLTAWVTDKPTNGNIISGEDGGIVVKGLDAGTYILTEVETLPGYNMLTDTITVVVAEDGAVTYQYTSKVDQGEAGNTITIENKTGTELPSTGGMGTTIFYIVGGVLVLGAAVLLVTKRRMNATK